MEAMKISAAWLKCMIRQANTDQNPPQKTAPATMVQ